MVNDLVQYRISNDSKEVFCIKIPCELEIDQANSQVYLHELFNHPQSIVKVALNSVTLSLLKRLQWSSNQATVRGLRKTCLLENGTRMESLGETPASMTVATTLLTQLSSTGSAVAWTVASTSEGQIWKMTRSRRKRKRRFLWKELNTCGRSPGSTTSNSEHSRDSRKS